MNVMAYETDDTINVHINRAQACERCGISLDMIDGQNWADGEWVGVFKATDETTLAYAIASKVLSPGIELLCQRVKQ